jgi:hypothetical protein
VRGPHPAHEVLESGDGVVGHEQLHRAAGQRRRHVGRRQPGPAGDDDALGQGSVGRGRGDGAEVAEVADRGRVGDAGDAVAGQAAADGRQVGRRRRGQAVAQPAVEPLEAPGRAAAVVALDAGVGGIGRHGRVGAVTVAGQADMRQRPGVQHPPAAGAVLHPHRPVDDQRVEPPAVERPGDRLVVADRPQPLARVERGVGLVERGGELVGVVDDGRADPRSALDRSQRHEVDVVVVEARQQGAPGAVDHLLAGARRQRTADRQDHTVRRSYVDEAPVDHDVTQQQATLRVARPAGHPDERTSRPGAAWTPLAPRVRGCADRRSRGPIPTDRHLSSDVDVRQVSICRESGPLRSSKSGKH